MTEEIKENPVKTDYNNPDYYENRELSWLSFNYRVMEEAADKRNPLLERFSFLAIASSNLDEYMMVRVAGLQDQNRYMPKATDSKKNWTAKRQLEEIAKKNHENVDYQYQLFNQLKEEAKAENIHFVSFSDLSDKEMSQISDYFGSFIYPALTPVGIDAYRPFPHLANKGTNLFVNLRKGDQKRIAIVTIPSLFDRYYHYKEGGNHYLIDMYDIIQHFSYSLFTGYEVQSSFLFRVTRNADLEIHEEGAEDLLDIIEDYLKERTKGEAVRLEVDVRAVDQKELAQGVLFLQKELKLSDDDIYLIDGPLDLTGLNELKDLFETSHPQLVYSPFKPVYPSELAGRDIFSIASQKDLLFHHPYESFDPVVEFIEQAADDPNTISIKQTLYRVSKNSPIINALIRASENGKQVTALVELKARFDEESNVKWAKRLEDAGCQVIYGKNYLKTHSKIALVVKKESNKLKRYVHLGTGNYNDRTARIYEDLGLITSNELIVEDATNFFNYLSGYTEIPDYHHFHVSPFNIQDYFMELCDREIKNQQEYGNGRIIAKMNSLTSKDVIKKLYETSQAGVKIDLIIRGICCLVPGIPGLSENIRVISVVGRFLEHSRIYYFHNNGDDLVYLSSADLMTRNLQHRVEIEFPILDPQLKNRVIDILNTYLKDNTKARYKLSDCSYRYVENEEEEINAQETFMQEALDSQSAQQELARTTWWERLTKKFL